MSFEDYYCLTLQPREGFTVNGRCIVPVSLRNGMEKSVDASALDQNRSSVVTYGVPFHQIPRTDRTMDEG